MGTYWNQETKRCLQEETLSVNVDEDQIETNSRNNDIENIKNFYYHPLNKQLDYQSQNYVPYSMSNNQR